MKFLLLLFLLALWCWASADAITDHEIEQRADYKSCKRTCRWKGFCRQICLDSVRRWLAPGKREVFEVVESGAGAIGDDAGGARVKRVGICSDMCLNDDSCYWDCTKDETWPWADDKKREVVERVADGREEDAGVARVKRDTRPKRCLKRCGAGDSDCMDGCLLEDRWNRQRAAILSIPEYPSEKCDKECDEKWFHWYKCAEECTEQEVLDNRGHKREVVERGADGRGEDAGVARVKRDDPPTLDVAPSERCLHECPEGEKGCLDRCMLEEYGLLPPGEKKREVVDAPSKRVARGGCMEDCLRQAGPYLCSKACGRTGHYRRRGGIESNERSGGRGSGAREA